VSGAGAPKLDPSDLGNVAGLKIAVVAAQWHGQVIEGLLDGTHRALKEAGLEAALVLRVPGAFELPVAARRLAATHDAVVALGVVVRGGTPHFEYVCQAATLGLTQVTVETGVPIGFGLLTTENDEQAFARSGLPGSTEDKGYEAAQAAVQTAAALRGFPL
jgi:6,7-dimethyl-8-ribityllumazine synthase